MKFLATIFISGLLAFAAFSQTTKPKTVAKPKQTAVKKKPSDTNNKTAKPKGKPTASKAKATDSKKKAVGSKTKPTGLKNNPAAPNPKSNASKTKTASPKSRPNDTFPKPGETAEWERALAVTDGMQRVAALKKFVETFAKSPKIPDAQSMIVTIQSDLGNDKLTSGEIAGAVQLYQAAVSDAPKPVPDQLFTDTLSKFPANLYFRSARAEAFEITKILETKSDTSVSQLLNIAAFYMSVENGSEARRVAEKAIKLDSTSAAAYQTLGLASRIDFLLDDSAAAYTKALEMDPDSLSARRGLAEMKRSLGKAEEAVALYREILAKEADNLPAQTGLILALFDAGKRSDAETEMAKSLTANPTNVILQAGAAYWYAANGDGEKAVEFAQKAIATDPRFIWSHVALARGQVARKNPIAAEKTLLAARRYGNFPTLEYEIASARVAAGFYREAAEELAKNFSVKDGVVYTNLGGRISRGSRDFTELVGFERRASIFAPTAADSPENSARMTALLELKQELDLAMPRPEVAARAVDVFVRGDDAMKVHRQIFAGSQLLEKTVALPKVIEITRAAPQSLDAGLDVANPSAAVMASELYESRSIAAVRGDYVNVPDVPRPTLSAILRGRIEEISGWAFYQMENPVQAAIHLKRAVSVLPPDSAWWHSSTWRLGTALMLSGKESEALEAYIRTYKSGKPDPLRYNAIESLYKRINGHTMGLENRIGPNPAPPASVAQKIEPTPTPTPVAVLVEQPKPEPTPALTPEGSKPIATPESSPSPRPEPTPVAVPVETPKIEATPALENSPSPTPESTPASVPLETPKADSTPTPTPEESPKPTPEEIKPSVSPETTSEVKKTPEEKPRETVAELKPLETPKELFPPVIITIPPPDTGKTALKADAKPEPSPTPVEARPVEETSPTPTPEPKSAEPESNKTPGSLDGRARIVEGAPVTPAEIKPCTLTVSEESITIHNGGSDLAVIVGRTDDLDLEELTAVSTSPQDVNIRREIIAGVKSRALFVIGSTSPKAGIYQVKFEMPCGKKEVVVRVR